MRHEAESLYDDTQTWVLADADLLAGAIANLVDNALKYAGDGACITIATTQSGDRALLTVRDNGQGVAAKHLALLGTRFYRIAQIGRASCRARVCQYV